MCGGQPVRWKRPLLPPARHGPPGSDGMRLLVDTLEVLDASAGGAHASALKAAWPLPACLAGVSACDGAAQALRSVRAASSRTIRRALRKGARLRRWRGRRVAGPVRAPRLFDLPLQLLHCAAVVSKMVIYLLIWSASLHAMLASLCNSLLFHASPSRLRYQLLYMSHDQELVDNVALHPQGLGAVLWQQAAAIQDRNPRPCLAGLCQPNEARHALLTGAEGSS